MSHKGRWDSNEWRLLLLVRNAPNGFYSWDYEQLPEADQTVFMRLVKNGRIERYDYISQKHGMGWAAHLSKQAFKFRLRKRG